MNQILMGLLVFLRAWARDAGIELKLTNIKLCNVTDSVAPSENVSDDRIQSSGRCGRSAR